jgi:WD40 repeat protein/Flp pilus assembly protein TadD
VADLAADLRRFVEDRPVRARRITAPKRLWRWCRREPRTAGLLAALLAVLVAGLVGVATQWRRAEGKVRDEADARRRAESAQEEARAHLYLSNVAQARLEWRLNNVAAAERLLEQCEPGRRGWEWHYLRGVNRPELFTIPNPDLSMVFGVAFSPDGRLLAFTGWDYYRNSDGHAPTPVEIWEVRRGQKVMTLSARGVGLRPTFSPDSRLLAVSGSWHPVQLWDVATGKPLQVWKEAGVAAFSPDGRLLAVGDPKSVTVRDVATGRLVHRFPSQGGRVRFSPDGRLLAVSGRGAVELRGAETGREVGRLPYGRGDLVDLYFPELGPDLAFSRDGKLVATATNPPRVWEVATRRPLTTLGGHAGIVPGIAFSPDGRRIATAGADGTVRLWDAQAGAELAVLRGHTGIVACVTFHPDGWCLASGGRQPGDVKLWDLTRHPEYRTLPAGAAPALAFDAAGRLKLVTNLGRVQSQDPESGQTEEGPRIDLLRRWVSPAALAAFSGDGRRLAAVSADQRTVKVLDAATGRELAALHGLEALPVQVAFSPDGRRVGATSRAGGKGPGRAVQVWDAATGEPLAHFRRTPPPPSPFYAAVALSPNGKRLAFDDYEVERPPGQDATARARVRVCDAAVGRELLAMPAGGGGVTCLAFSPDDRLLAAGVWDRSGGRILVWDAAMGQRLSEDRLEFVPLSLSFNPDGRRLAAVGREMVVLWDVRSGKGILTLRGAPPRPTDLGSNATLAWSRDGRRLAASNWDGSVAVWGGNGREAAADSGPLGRVPPARVFAWHLGEAEAALRAGQPSGAAFHLERLRAVEPSDLASRLRRGRLHVRRGDWGLAAADFARVFTAGEPDDPRAWLDHVRVLVLREDRAGYRRLVPRMLAHCGPRTDIYNPEPEQARACVLAPGALADPTEAVRGAERVVKDPRAKKAEALLSLGLAHYRAGHWEKAAARVEEAIARRPDAAWLGWPVLAMAHARLGHAEEARRWLRRAEGWRQQEGRRLVEESAGFAPPERADFEILLREAAALVSGRKP